MPAELVEATVPLAMSAAAVLAGGHVRERRRRRFLNRALHEVRRPLQALVLAAGDPVRAEPVVEAVAELDAAINGRAPARTTERIAVRNLAEAVVARWAETATTATARPVLRWRAGQANVIGDRAQLTRALDNLVANAIEHGRGPIEMLGAVRRDRVRILVRDAGERGGRPMSGRRDPRRGHGLEIVREVAGAHGGRFVLRCSAAVTIAVLELPLAAEAVPPRAA